MASNKLCGYRTEAFKYITWKADVPHGFRGFQNNINVNLYYNGRYNPSYSPLKVWKIWYFDLNDYEKIYLRAFGDAVLLFTLVSFVFSMDPMACYSSAKFVVMKEIYLLFSV